MLVGPAKSNKTTIAYAIGKAIADTSTSECLGHKVIEHGNVLYIALEGGLGPQINAFGICEHFEVIDEKFFTIDNPNNFKLIESYIEKNQIKLLIIDALYKAMDGNIANADEVRPLLIKLEDLTRKHKVTVLMLHHTNRAVGKAEQGVNDISGSFNIVRSSEFTMLLSSEVKTEDEEIAEANMSKEEYAKLPNLRSFCYMSLFYWLYRFGIRGVRPDETFNEVFEDILRIIHIMFSKKCCLLYYLSLRISIIN